MAYLTFPKWLVLVCNIHNDIWMLQTKTSHLGKVRYAIILLGWRYATFIHKSWTKICQICLYNNRIAWSCDVVKIVFVFHNLFIILCPYFQITFIYNNLFMYAYVLSGTITRIISWTSCVHHSMCFCNSLSSVISLSLVLWYGSDVMGKQSHFHICVLCVQLIGHA